MFAKKHRLPLPLQKQVPQKTISTSYFLMKVFNGGTGYNRFGIIISNRAVKKSTRRHFWKRRMTEFLKTWPNFKKDFLVIASPRIEGITPASLKQEFQRVLQKVAK